MSRMSGNSSIATQACELTYLDSLIARNLRDNSMSTQAGIDMKLQRLLSPLLFATGVGFAGLASAHGANDTVKPNFDHLITNIPGKSLIAVEVLYPPGGASLP